MKVFGLLRPEWRYFLPGLLCAVIVGTCGPILPSLVITPFVDQVLGAAQRFDLVPELIARAAALILIGATAQYAQDTLFGAGAARFGARMRALVYGKLLRANLSNARADTRTSGGQVSRAALDVRELESFYSWEMPALISQGLTMLVAFTVVMIQNPRLTLSLALVLLPLGYLLGLIGKRIESAFRATQDAAETASSAMTEGLTRLEIIKAYNLESRVLDRFLKPNELQRRSSARRARYQSMHYPISQVAVALGMGVLMLLGVNEVRDGRMSGATLIAYLTTLAIMIAPVQIFARVYARLSAMREPARSLSAILSLPAEPDPGHLTQPETGAWRGALELRDLSFCYPGSSVPALERVNLHLRPGESVALVGPSGSGKTTLSRLLLRLLEPDAGSIYLDGHELRAYQLGVARAQIALVPQQPALFTGSIHDNLILVKPDATPHDIWRALEDASLADEVRAMPAGLDTIIGENNAGISGGQAQRLAIARALLLDAHVIVLDEPTSALDAHSEAQIKRTLERLHGTRTVIIIAHRLTTVEHVDRVVVLDGGRIIEQGTHRDLADSGGAFAALLEAARG